MKLAMITTYLILSLHRASSWVIKEKTCYTKDSREQIPLPFVESALFPIRGVQCSNNDFFLFLFLCHFCGYTTSCARPA